ncbi:Hpt domain-containing protein, partial [Parathalassolituus penaei]
MSQDYIALEWVKGEIQETLQQAQQSLEAYGENPQDKSRLKFCFSYLHQVRGTLQMVEFYGAALLAEEMEAVAEGLSESSLASEHDGLQVLMQAIIQLPHYLDHVKVGRRDLPIVLLPILNELRSVRGEALLSETALFSPRMVRRAVLRSDQLKRFRTEEFQQWIRKVRQMFQTATLQLFQGKDAAAAKDYLRKVFERLHTTLGHTPNGVIWQPAMAFAEWLVGQKSIPGSAKQHLRDIDLMLKALILEGADQLNQPAQDELVKNLLFFVARTKVNGPAIRAVQEAFALENALPSEAEIQKERDALAGPDRATISQVLSALIEEITAIKDKLDLAVRDTGSRAVLLQEAQPSAKQVCDTMAMLGLGMPRDVIQEQLNTLNSMIASGNSHDQQLQDIAGALLYVEATLANMIREGQLDLRVAAGSLTEEQKAVLRESRNALEQVKDAIIAYVANQWDASELRSVPQLLRSIAGSLGMVPLDSVSFVLRHAAPFVEDIIQNGTRIDWTTLDNFADVLSGVEYYLERYSENPHNAGEDILSRANGALARLPGVQLPKPEPVAPAVETAPAEKPTVAQTPVAAPKPVVVAEEPTVVVAEEPTVVVAEEPAVVVAEEPAVVVAEEPAVVVADEPVVVADEPVVVAEEPVVVAEEPAVVVAEEPAVVVAEEPAVVVAEEPVVVVAEEPVVVAEEPAVVVPAPVAAPVRSAAPAYDMVKAPSVAEPEDSDLIDDEIIEIFLEEAEEVTATLDEYWPQFRANPQNNEAMTTVRRAFHTLKGSGRMVQAMVIGELAWSIENMFNRVIDKTINVSDNMMDIVQHVLENLPLLIDDFRCRRGTSINTQPLMDYAFTIAAGKPVPALEQYLKVDDVPVADAPVTAHGRESATASTRPDGSGDAEEDDRTAQYEGSSDTDTSVVSVDTTEAAAELPLAEAIVVDTSVSEPEIVVGPEALSQPVVEQVLGTEESDDDLALIDVFVQEANGHLDVVNRFVAESAAANYENPLGDQVQRALHTLKGSAHMAGISAIANLASPLERLIKEFRAYQVGNSRDLTELVRDGAAMIGSALRDKVRLHSGMISGNQTYLRRIEQIERTLLLPIMEEADRADNVPNPQAIAQFLEQGMDSLLDAEQLIRRWQEMGDDTVLSTLCSDLVAVAGGAEQAEQPRIAELCSALYEFYREILSSGLSPRPEWLSLALNGQEELLNMMDCLAAGQVLEVPEVLEAIRAVANQLSVENLLKVPAPAISEEDGLDVLNAILDDSTDDGAHAALLGLLDADDDRIADEADSIGPDALTENNQTSDWTISVYDTPVLGSTEPVATPASTIDADIQRLLDEQADGQTDAADSQVDVQTFDAIHFPDTEPVITNEAIVQEPEQIELVSDEPEHDLPVGILTQELLVEEAMVLEQQPSDLIADELVYDLPADNSELLLQEPVTD